MSHDWAHRVAGWPQLGSMNTLQDNNEDERDLFGTNRIQQEIEKGMFLQDVSSGHPLVLDPIEYETLFGTPTKEDLEYLTQSFLIQYHRLGMKVDTLFDIWGGDWIFEILKFCERSEEYEVCSIIKDIYSEYMEGSKQIKHLIKVTE